jgi:hypothetical protein
MELPNLALETERDQWDLFELGDPSPGSDILPFWWLGNDYMITLNFKWASAVHPEQ